MNDNLSIKSAQEMIKQITNKYNLELSPELRYIDLSSEVGELGKEILLSTGYGANPFIATDNLESEIGDTFYSLICIANSLNIDLSNSLIKVLQKYEKRFSEKGNIGSE